MNSSVNSSAVEVIDLGHYWQVIRRQLKKILALSFVATLISVLVVLSITPVYQATSTLMIESSSNNILSIEEVYGLSNSGSEYFLTQFEILKSRDIARRVVESLDLIDNPEFNPFHSANKKSFSLRAMIFGEKKGEPPTDKQIMAKTIESFWAAISINPVRQTQLVKISVSSRDVEFAPVAANAIAVAYIESQLDARIGMTQQAANWLRERLGGLKQKLIKSEIALQEFRESKGLLDIEGVDTLVSSELQQITKRLVEVRSERINAETNYFQLKKLKNTSYNSLSSLPIILKNPFVARIKELESNTELKVSELSKRYGPKHPRMIAAQSDLDAVRETLLTQMMRIAEGIENEYSAAKTKEQSLLRALTNSKKDMLLINQTEFQLADYVRTVEVNRTLYETFFQRINETAETGTLQAANARVVDEAVISARPIKPKKKLIVVLALVVSLMFGIALAFLLDALDSTIKSADDVDHKLGVPLLGLLPLLGTENIKSPTREQAPVYSFIHGESEGFKESVRTLRTSLTLASLQDPVQVLLFTSTVPGEGKTTTSVNLASAYGQMDKVLLIDADMRRPTVAKQLQIPPRSPGLSNALAYPESLDESIYTIEDLNIDVMPAGAIPPNPLELLSSKNFKEMLEVLRGRYQKIIIDSAPMQAVSDALYLSTLTDGLVYVVKADSTVDKQVKTGLARLDDSNARILGVVLNQVDIEKEGRYSDSYGGYYDSYSYKRNESS